MPVNGDDRHSGARRTQASRSAATRAALLDAGRRLFAERGYAGAGREEIVELAGVTRGALQHHFGRKQELFLAVVEELEAELGGRIMEAATQAAGDPMEELVLGCRAFLDAATDVAFRRIVLLDAPAVLGWQAWRELDARFGLGLVTMALDAAMEAGQVERQPVDPLAHMLLAALNEGAMLVAQADDQAAARAEVGAAVDNFLGNLRNARTQPPL
ncbi:MAG: TetR/AcrR family transcriptional regulator [Actinobacteria bacterium]|nr:TetR/AcrR family transcriptional regulator [Actinomycetota bacterium]